MEKLKFDIEISSEELEMLNKLIFQGCLDLEMYLKRQISKVIKRHNYLISYAEAEPAQKAG